MQSTKNMLCTWRATRLQNKSTFYNPRFSSVFDPCCSSVGILSKKINCRLSHAAKQYYVARQNKESKKVRLQKFTEINYTKLTKLKKKMYRVSQKNIQNLRQDIDTNIKNLVASITPDTSVKMTFG